MIPMPFIAIEGGGTRASAGRYANGTCVGAAEGGPCNPSAYGPDHCARVIIGLCRELGATEPFDLYLALAGAGAPALDTPMAASIFAALPVRRIVVCGDLQPVLLANAGTAPAAMVIAGTGSSVVAQNGRGQLFSVGGRGALLGDEGSAYAIAVAALRAVAAARDGLGPATALEEALPKAAGLATYSDFIPWHPRATKSEIAALVQPVIALAEAGDDAACACVAEQVDQLAQLVAAAQSRAELDYDVPLFLQGGMFKMFPLYRAVFEVALQGRGVVLTPTDLKTVGHAAVAVLAQEDPLPPWAREYARPAATAPATTSTEAAHAGPALDALDAAGIVDALHAADAEALAATGAVRTAIAEAITQAAEALRSGGRLIYAGAGTSGRLGVLDASECPPTFGVSPDRIVGVIAGGEPALRNSVEGAEDDEAQGRADIAALNVAPPDFVLGIAASGTTPYVLAALDESRARGARTGLLCCNPAAATPGLLIALPTGPEVLAGSTRLKAGTATKLVLNQISTGALTLTGHVYRGRMVRMRAVNAKLRTRAVRMVATLGGVEEAHAEATLQQCGYDIPVALVSVTYEVPVDTARTLLSEANYDLHRLMEQAS